MLSTLFWLSSFRGVCIKDHAIFVDVQPLPLRHNSNVVCFLPCPFVGDLDYPYKSDHILKIVTNILPFVYPLQKFELIARYGRYSDLKNYFNDDIFLKELCIIGE
jgi:hypothetical protein